MSRVRTETATPGFKFPDLFPLRFFRSRVPKALSFKLPVIFSPQKQLSPLFKHPLVCTDRILPLMIAQQESIFIKDRRMIHQMFNNIKKMGKPMSMISYDPQESEKQNCFFSKISNTKRNSPRKGRILKKRGGKVPILKKSSPQKHEKQQKPRSRNTFLNKNQQQADYKNDHSSQSLGKQNTPKAYIQEPKVHTRD